jgi:hypothetical protein
VNAAALKKLNELNPAIMHSVTQQSRNSIHMFVQCECKLAKVKGSKQTQIKVTHSPKWAILLAAGWGKQGPAGPPGL